ncbi:MAG: helicase-related protein [Candidatus Daviesbacteria bacterium]|nr:helicase-related protein [Candidatus Daviesbacteria bacterium]
MPIIDNNLQTMHKALINALTSAERVDIEVAFFYFSGWRLLANHLKDKKIRILVGKYIDPEAIPELLSKMKQEGEDVDLEPFRPRQTIPTRGGKKQAYVKSFTRLSNESALLDDSDDQDAYKILENKIVDGSLEIKLTDRPEHGKMYIFHNKPEFSQNKDYPGTVFMGSSNFTFQGLLNQGELNERYSDKEHYLMYVNKFKSLWDDSKNIDIATLENKDDLLKQFKDELWIHASPSPYAVYIRVLHELFGKEDTESMKTPSQITKNKYFDLEYQIDAIKSVLNKLEKYDGVILADVVGLGKSIIASAVAHNADLKTIIIAPPHLQEQWDDYQEEFRLPGARVFSSGAVDDVYEKYKNNNQPLLIIVDEAHRYRNEDTDDYRMLHHICTSHPENKVILLTATPFNNDPKDVFALIKLFQIPGQSTIRSVDNLSLRFRELIERYKKLNRDMRRGTADEAHIDKEADEISIELRRLIENVIIRRSRLDLRAITRYKEDLEKQHIDFAEVEGPELLTYELGSLSDLYFDTLLKLTKTDEEEGGFIGARYKPAEYIENREAFLKAYGKDLDESDLKTAQTNMAKFMKRLLVMRFESSKDAFRSTLVNMIASTKMVEDWWYKLGKVPIMKKGHIPDPDTILSTSGDDVNEEINKQNSEKELQELKESKGLIAVDKSLIDVRFIEDVIKDRELLTQIHKDWFEPKSLSIKDLDPKLDKVKMQIDTLLSENPERKIVVFSTYADTINYLFEELGKRGLNRVLKYTAADASKRMKKTVRANFDAGLDKADQENDYDVLVATDALSEGYNLHRAGVVINYDITYNPTRVIQRVGRINRINKKVFDKLFIYNFFPTEKGEAIIRIGEISTLKMRLFNSVVGSDTKTLTDNEKLQTFFKDEYQKAVDESEVLSWDATHYEAYDQAKKDKEAFDEALEIKPRSRVIRDGQKVPAIVAFGKKGEHVIFVLKELEVPSIVAAEIALEYFKAEKGEKGIKADKQYDEVFKLIRDLLFEKHPLPSISGRRSESLKKIEIIEKGLQRAKDYCQDLAQIIKKYDGINEGDLKSISQLSVINCEKAFEELKEIVPQHQIDSINERASRLEGEYETIVLSEDIRL